MCHKTRLTPPLLATGRAVALLADAKQVLLSPQEELPLADGRRRKTSLAQFALRHQVVLRPRLDDAHHAVVRQEVRPAFGRQQRSAVMPADAFLPLPLARRGLVATGDAV